jgi:hypothetical protein
MLSKKEAAYTILPILFSLWLTSLITVYLTSNSEIHPFHSVASLILIISTASLSTDLFLMGLKELGVLEYLKNKFAFFRD